MLPALPRGGPLAPVHSFLNVSAASPSSPPPDVWVTAIKKQDGPGAEGLAVRLFGVSAADQAAVTLALSVGAPLAGAAATDLIELNPAPLPGVAGGTTVALDVGHWAIETLVPRILIVSGDGNDAVRGADGKVCNVVRKATQCSLHAKERQR